MMRPALHAEILSTDLPEPLEWKSWRPETGVIDVVLLIIVTWEPSGESTDFQLVVRNVAGLSRHLRRNGLLSGRYTLFVDTWDGDAIEGFITNHIQTAARLPEDEQIPYLARHFLWEYEDEGFIPF